MQLQSLVEASADIVRIVHLREGDTYKRLEKDYQSNYSMRYGVVQTIDFNGEDTVITAIEFTDNYQGAKAETKVFGNNSDLKLFATTPEELHVHFMEVTEAASRYVKTKQEELDKAQESSRLLASVISKVKNGSAQPPVTRNTLEPTPPVIEAEPVEDDDSDDHLDRYL